MCRFVGDKHSTSERSNPNDCWIIRGGQGYIAILSKNWLRFLIMCLIQRLQLVGFVSVVSGAGVECGDSGTGLVTLKTVTVKLAAESVESEAELVRFEAEAGVVRPEVRSVKLEAGPVKLEMGTGSVTSFKHKVTSATYRAPTVVQHKSGMSMCLSSFSTKEFF
ncbi:unnamed protein product [Gongylonema pulchrum]|uniref:Uncharacterized protein n=1 Tax=Gongylonema pulchrum TaxID=637853 RepID=A0A183EIH0_9BILA|nr:unnamed protein product [Gongylonema pulchrum]